VPLSVLIISCSLNTLSRSHLLAQTAESAIRNFDINAELVDLREWELPLCDGRDSLSHPSVAPLAAKITRASAVLVASPIYNYDLNAVAKNVVELTGTAWSEKPVGFLCTAGGRSSYMSPIGLANSLMFDFRSLIIPRFVYAVKDDFKDNGDLSDQLRARIDELVQATVDLARALAWLKVTDS